MGGGGGDGGAGGGMVEVGEWRLVARLAEFSFTVVVDECGETAHEMD